MVWYGGCRCVMSELAFAFAFICGSLSSSDNYHTIPYSTVQYSTVQYACVRGTVECPDPIIKSLLASFLLGFHLSEEIGSIA